MVTDSSLTSGNKYICLSKIDFSYELEGINKSCNDLSYYGKWSTKNDSLSSYGHYVEGNGIVKFELDSNSTGFAIYGFTSDKFKAKILIDGKTYEVNKTLNDKIIFDHSLKKSNKKHKIEIVVESGYIAIDSIFIGN